MLGRPEVEVMICGLFFLIHLVLLRGSKLGKEIDLHDAVVRINYAPTKVLDRRPEG